MKVVAFLTEHAVDVWNVSNGEVEFFTPKIVLMEDGNRISGIK